MGNDGGSIAKRSDLVRLKQRAEAVDKQEQEIVRWFFCALSKLPLEQPVVSDPLGKLYNKSAALEYLLHPPAPDGSSHSIYGADGDAIANHLSSLKDLVTLKLTPNPTYDASSPSGTKARWICPISMKEMVGGNGRKDASRWVYLRGCGCVVTEGGIKQLRAGSSGPEQECLICGTSYAKDSDRETVTINPNADEEEAMRIALAARRRLEKAEKAEKERRRKEKKEASGKKRKAEVVLSPVIPRDDGDDAATLDDAPKKVRLDADRRPHAPQPASKLAKLIASETERKAAGQSAAVSSIYGPRDADGKQLLGQQRESWMTRGTWTRYA